MNQSNCDETYQWLGDRSYMFSWADFMALAAKPRFLSTSVFVLAFSRASLWNSMVDSVPSICASCFSYRFFLFKACRAAEEGDTERNKRRTNHSTQCHKNRFSAVTQRKWSKPVNHGDSDVMEAWIGAVIVSTTSLVKLQWSTLTSTWQIRWKNCKVEINQPEQSHDHN